MAKKKILTPIEQKTVSTIDLPGSGLMSFAPKSDGNFYIKNPVGEEFQILTTKDRRNDVRVTGLTDNSLVTETGIRNAINEAVPSDIIPIYNVSSFNQFIEAYNSIRSKYTGGVIRCTGDIIMTSDLTVDLTGIEISGDGINWRFYNDVYLNPSTVRKLIITAGSPTFRGIRFWGSSGQSSIEMDKGTNRHCFDISPVDTSKSVYITFTDCGFLDIVAGQTTGPVIRVTSNMSYNASINLNFIRCKIASHALASIAYKGFKIYHSYDQVSSTAINVSVQGQIPSPEKELDNTSTLYVLQGYTTNTLFNFHSDETAWLDTQTSTTGLTRTNTMFSLQNSSAFGETDCFMYSKDDDRKNIYRAPLRNLQKAISLNEGVLAGRELGGGPGEIQEIVIGSGLSLSGNVLNAAGSTPTVPYIKSVLNSSYLINSQTNWLNITANFTINSITLPKGVYMINAQACFVRSSSTLTYVGFKIQANTTSILAAEGDMNRSLSLSGNTIFEIEKDTMITFHVYASASGVVSVISTTSLAPQMAEGTTQMTLLKIG